MFTLSEFQADNTNYGHTQSSNVHLQTKLFMGKGKGPPKPKRLHGVPGG